MTESLEYREIAPPVRLQQHVRCIWRLRGSAPTAAAAESERIVPDGCVELVMNFADPFIRTAPGVAAHGQPMRLIAGQITRALSIRPSGRIDLWGVRFHPWTAAGFLGVTGTEMRDQLFALDEIASRLEAAISTVYDGDEAGRYARLVRAIESWVTRLPATSLPAERLVRLASSSHQPLSVKRLARHSGLSTRRVQAVFRDDVGLTPKQLLRITRFQRALGIARARPALSWGAVAAHAGYFDQAHLIHESHEIAGCTPASLLARDAELTEAFLTG